MKKIPRKEKPVIIKQEKIKKTLRKEEPVIIKQENPIYFKLGHYESIESKKDLLILESSFLNILKMMRGYNLLRTEELKIKSEILNAVRKLNLSMKRTKAIFPFLEIPERLKRKEVINVVEPVEEIKQKKEVFDDDLESQLKDIQARLNSIGR